MILPKRTKFTSDKYENGLHYDKVEEKITVHIWEREKENTLDPSSLYYIENRTENSLYYLRACGSNPYYAHDRNNIPNITELI